MHEVPDDGKRLVRVWNVSLINGKKIRVATIERGERQAEEMCRGCYAPCCRGKLYPVLNSEEFLNRKFPFHYMKTHHWIKKQVPRADYLVTLAVSDDGCPFFDKENLKCKLWPNPPQACLSYSCRNDDRPEFKEFFEKREKQWSGP